jgi:DNA-binding transcriptional LysR family regulator
MGELEAIRTFIAVSAQRSFTGAARQLGMTPASVTRTISALEQRLGVQLLVCGLNEPASAGVREGVA